ARGRARGALRPHGRWHRSGRRGDRAGAVRAATAGSLRRATPVRGHHRAVPRAPDLLAGCRAGADVRIDPAAARNRLVTEARPARSRPWCDRFAAMIEALGASGGGDEARPRDDAQSLRRDLTSKLYFELAKFPGVATRNDHYLALSYAVRDRLLYRWVNSART